MTNKSNLGIDQQLLNAQVAIENALSDAGILAALTVFGYDTAKINVGKTLYHAALTLTNQQKAKYGAQYGMTAEIKTAFDTADKAYMRSLKVARVAFKGNPQATAALMLRGIRKGSLSGWLEQVQAFYGNLLADADLMSVISEFGYTQRKLEAEQALAAAVAQANLAQEKGKGGAQEATKRRDAKLDALTDWLADFKAIAQVALDETPQQLEKLGLGTVS